VTDAIQDLGNTSKAKGVEVAAFVENLTKSVALPELPRDLITHGFLQLFFSLGKEVRSGLFIAQKPEQPA
jgi:hypothetical protein